MRIRNIKNANEIVDNCDVVIKEPYMKKGNWQEEFGNANDIYLEIGMGKGDFIIDMAIKHPEYNFVGIEKYTSVMARAIKKIPKDLRNVRLINVDALDIGDIFNKEIMGIYLNFSDPWPKKRQSRRRLTSEVFLKLYDEVFKYDGLIIQKTDNTGLFESSIISLNNYGYIIEDISLDLWQTDKVYSETEYEHKFRLQGVKINYLKARKKNI